MDEHKLRCACGCFLEVIEYINENSGEEEEYTCNNKNCKLKK